MLILHITHGVERDGDSVSYLIMDRPGHARNLSFELYCCNCRLAIDLRLVYVLRISRYDCCKNS